MPLVTTTEMFKKAYAGKYAVGACPGPRPSTPRYRVFIFGRSTEQQLRRYRRSHDLSLHAGKPDERHQTRDLAILTALIERDRDGTVRARRFA